MSIERKAVKIAPKRQPDEIVLKNERIGELLGLKDVPLHTLTWKEPRLDLGTGDCYPLVDVLERVAELLAKKTNPKKHKT